MVAPEAVAVQPDAYDTDVSDAEWALVRPHVDVPAKTGPQRTVDLRAVWNALAYKLRTGCQWHLLPKGFPPKSTECRAKCRRDGYPKREKHRGRWPGAWGRWGQKG